MRTMFQEITEDLLEEITGTSEIPDIATIFPADERSERVLSRLSESQKQESYFDYRISGKYRGVTLDNPLRFCLECGEVNEGLMSTYPYKVTVEKIKEYFGLSDNHIRVSINDINGEIKGIDILIPSIKENVKQMVKAMDYCGYFLSQTENMEDIPENEWVVLSFEPKFQNDITMDLSNNFRFLFHWTPTKHLDKILRNGLCPRSNNTFMNYPERIYFIASWDINDVVRKGKVLFYKAKDNDNCLNDEYDYIKDGIRHTRYTLLKINTHSLNNNIRFHADYNIRFHADYNFSGCVYTKDNIPPSVINIEGEFEFKAEIH